MFNEDSKEKLDKTVLQQIVFGLMSLFALLIVSLAIAFLVLRKNGMSSEGIGRSVARVVRFVAKKPGFRWLVDFTQHHRKGFGITAGLFAAALMPFAIGAALFVFLAVTAIYGFSYLARLVPDEVSSELKDAGIYGPQLVYGYDGELVPRDSADAMRRQ